MSGAIPPLPQYAFMAWCLVKSTGTTLPFIYKRTALALQRLRRRAYGENIHELSFISPDPTGCVASQYTKDIVSGCPIVVQNEYIMRHNKVCTHLHHSTC